MPAKFVDQYLPSGLSLTRTTVTPTTLLPNAPLEPLPYKDQQLAWLLVQWALFLGMLFASGRTMSEEDRLTFWAVGLLFVSGSYFWRGHVERGKVYVVFAFLFTCVFVLAARAKPIRVVSAGLVLGLLIAARPTYGMVLIPLVLASRWRLVLASSVGFALSLSVPAVPFGASIWRHYADSMSAQAQQYLRWFGAVPETVSWYPGVIEGMGDGRWEAVSLPGFDSSVANLAHLAHLPVSVAAIYACLLVALAALATSLWFAGRGRRPRTEVLLLQGGVLTALAEFFLVATKYSYRDITLVPFLALVIAALGVPWLRRSRWAQVGIVGLAMGCLSVEWRPGLPGYTVLAGEILCFVCLVALTFVAVRRQEQLSTSPQARLAHTPTTDISPAAVSRA